MTFGLLCHILHPVRGEDEPLYPAKCFTSCIEFKPHASLGEQAVPPLNHAQGG